MKNMRKAFSFVEVLLVVVILGLIAAVFVPATVKIRKTTRENAISENISKIIRAGQRYNQDKSTKVVDYKTLVDSKYIDALLPVAGESYDGVVVDSAGGKISLPNKLGENIEKDY